MILRILHLSDLHFKATGENPVEDLDADIVTSSMINALSTISQTKPFDLIIITGDIAFSGKEDDYKVADAFCTKLKQISGLSGNKFAVVPGNHDVYRSAIKDALKRMCTFSTQKEINDILLDQELLPLVTRKFTAFNKFANKVSEIKLDTKNYYYVKKIHIHKDMQEFSINLLGLNSSLFAGYDGDDKQKLAMGLCQVNNAIKQLDDAALFSIAVFHHPFTCFHFEENVTLNLLKQNSQIILHGHLHNPLNRIIIDDMGENIIIGAGAGFETRESANSFNIIEIDPITGEGKIIFYKYIHMQHCWIINHEVNPHTADGTFTFTLKFNTKTGITTIPPASMELNENMDQYLAWLHDECGFIDIRGLIIGSGNAPKFTIDKLYIPLNTTTAVKTGRQGDGKKPLLQKEKFIPLSSVLMNQCVTIIGDPGSGKTTFLQYIASILGKAYREDNPAIVKEKLNLNKPYFPIFIRVGDLSGYIHYCREKK